MARCKNLMWFQPYPELVSETEVKVFTYFWPKKTTREFNSPYMTLLSPVSSLSSIAKSAATSSSSKIKHGGNWDENSFGVYFSD